MSSKRRVERELTNLSDEVLGELSVDERTDLFVAAASAGNDEWVTLLQQTAPWKRYQMAEFEYVRAVGILSTLSMVANAQLVQCCQAVTLAESQREAAVLAVLVEGLLGRCLESGGESARSRALEIVAREVYGDSGSRGWVKEVITRGIREAEHGGDVAEIRACDFEVIRARLSLYRWLSVWRRVAIDHLEISLAELLALTHAAEAGLGSVGKPVDEARCERVLGNVDVLIERCREFGGDEDLSREALDAEVDAFADEVAERFTLSRDSGETVE